MVKAQKAPRSIAYPSLTVEDALSRLDRLKERIGVNGSFSRETVATGIGYSSVSGASARAVAALVYYGLLTREKDMYTVSDVGRMWLFPNDENERPALIREAALKPKLFLQLYDEFKGQVLPKLLSNRLVTQHKLKPKTATDIVQTFRATFKYALLLDDNDMIISGTDQGNANTIINEDVPVEENINNLAVIDDSIKESSRDTYGRSAPTVLGGDYFGESWRLSINFSTHQYLGMEIMTKVRDLLANADELVDSLHKAGIK